MKNSCVTDEATKLASFFGTSLLGCGGEDLLSALLLPYRGIFHTCSVVASRIQAFGIHNDITYTS